MQRDSRLSSVGFSLLAVGAFLSVHAPSPAMQRVPRLSSVGCSLLAVGALSLFPTPAWAIPGSPHPGAFPPPEKSLARRPLHGCWFPSSV